MQICFWNKKAVESFLFQCCICTTGLVGKSYRNLKIFSKKLAGRKFSQLPTYRSHCYKWLDFLLFVLCLISLILLNFRIDTLGNRKCWQFHHNIFLMHSIFRQCSPIIFAAFAHFLDATSPIFLISCPEKHIGYRRVIRTRAVPLHQKQLYSPITAFLPEGYTSPEYRHNFLFYPL